LVNNTTYLSLSYNNSIFTVLDKIEPILYILREINNEYIPSLYNFINYNNNGLSDLMDFFFQTPMIFLALDTNAPYLYFYNIPFNINSNTTVLLNNKQVNIILPLNSNQFFNKITSPVYDKENLYNYDTFENIITNMSSLFDTIFQNSLYIDIINTLENAQTELINLNTNILNDINNYGSTTKQIIKNSSLINKINLFNYNNDDYSIYNKLAIDIYGNYTNIK